MSQTGTQKLSFLPTQVNTHVKVFSPPSFIYLSSPVPSGPRQEGIDTVKIQLKIQLDNLLLFIYFPDINLPVIPARP
jgi:hypothetical protein